PLVHTPARRISFMPLKEEAGVGGASGGLVAMGAVDVEPGASAVFERGVAERVRHGRRRGGRGGEQTALGPVGDLVHAGRTVVIEVARPGTDGDQCIALDMAGLALVAVWDGVVDRDGFAIGCDGLDHLPAADGGVDRFGLVFVPYVGI